MEPGSRLTRLGGAHHPTMMRIRERLADSLAQSFLSGPWTPADLATRADTLFSVKRPRDWLIRLILEVLRVFPETAPRPTIRTLREFIATSTRIEKPERREGETRLVRQRPAWRPTMQPAFGPPATWIVPPIVTTVELADWLQLTVGDLEWLANRPNWHSTPGDGPQCHYRYRWIEKPSGGRRLLEIPKPRLKQIQRRILDEIVSRIPAHSAAHAYRTDRSILTYVSPHTSQSLILHIDLREFFPSVHSSRIHAIFRTAGYPERVAALLTGLCTTSTPSHVLDQGLRRVQHEESWHRHRSPHLPQGAPTSPGLANLCAYRLDTRLHGLARVISGQYTRYADDLVFSGGDNLRSSVGRLRILINAIVLDEGFEIRHRKTCVMVRETRQQISGIRINHHPNIPRETFDALKSILHNCRRFGPVSQNRAGHPHFREHLQGRLAYWSSICPERVAKLQRIFDQIKWPDV